MKLGDKILKIRNKKNISQEQLSEMTGISFASIVKYERNERNPKPEQLKKIAEALDTSPYALKDLDVNSTADVLALLVQLFKHNGISIEAEKDADGYSIPETVKLTVLDSDTTNCLAVYKDMLDKKESIKNNPDHCSKKELNRKLEEIDENIEDAIISLVSEQKPLDETRTLSDSVGKTKPAEFRKLEGIVLDCTPLEYDFIIQSAKIIKKASRVKYDQSHSKK
ncbi:MAG: helix-turn-helix transcriptional regulator [Parasporobacterium sp.]|nr:helix-turn-helix transcriptional regulator [Parasporobacterium sp.]